MITTTLGQLANAAEALSAVMAIPLPSATAYRLTKLARLAQTEIVSFSDQKNAAIRRLGTPIDGTDDYRFEAAEKAVLIDELKALSEIAVELRADPISLKSLHGKAVAPAHLLALDDAGLLLDDTGDAPQA